MPMLQVEEKFSLMNRSLNEVEKRLRALGMLPMGSYSMVDWYFDTHQFCLTTSDCWLRYRERNGEGAWQLKRGATASPGGGASRGATVYEETEGMTAVMTAVNLLMSSKAKVESQSTFQGHEIPSLPINEDRLIPFARIVTQRSSWKLPSDDLVIDLDATDYGYAVGEAELLVESEDQIPAARQRIDAFLDKLLGNDRNEPPAQGKLEYYLQTSCPEMWKVLLESGIM